jgi:hypothetical protein
MPGTEPIRPRQQRIEPWRNAAHPAQVMAETETRCLNPGPRAGSHFGGMEWRYGESRDGHGAKYRIRGVIDDQEIGDYSGTAQITVS